MRVSKREYRTLGRAVSVGWPQLFETQILIDAFGAVRGIVTRSVSKFDQEKVAERPCQENGYRPLPSDEGALRALGSAQVSKNKASNQAGRNHSKSVSVWHRGIWLPGVIQYAVR